MKTLNDYGKDVMDAQARLDAVETDIEKTEAALDSLRSDHEKACADLAASRDALQQATDRVKNGDYGTEAAPTEAEINAILDDDTPFEGLNRAPPDDERDAQIPENRTLASNGAGV